MAESGAVEESDLALRAAVASGMVSVNGKHGYDKLTRKCRLFFIVGFAAWSADAFDFHALSIQTVKLADYYDTSNTNITTAITLTLLLRSVGAAIFGLAGVRGQH